MCNACYNAHTDPLFKENKILKIKDNFNLNCLKLYHKYKNQELPNFFNNMFTTNADIHSYLVDILLYSQKKWPSLFFI